MEAFVTADGGRAPPHRLFMQQRVDRPSTGGPIATSVRALCGGLTGHPLDHRPVNAGQLCPLRRAPSPPAAWRRGI